MVTSYSRGHKIKWTGKKWVYYDNNKTIDEMRPCKKCGKKPTLEGYDACLGELENVTHACCGHGVTEPYILNQIKRRKR